jgi:hypothetical protein
VPSGPGNMPRLVPQKKTCLGFASTRFLKSTLISTISRNLQIPEFEMEFSILTVKL